MSLAQYSPPPKLYSIFERAPSQQAMKLECIALFLNFLTWLVEGDTTPNW